MRTYLLDASAVVQLYLPGDSKEKRVVSFIREQKTKFREAVLYLPSFCIAEVFNALARKHFAERTLSEAEYKDCLTRFRSDVHWGKVFYPYELHRYHIIGADRVIPVEHYFAQQTDQKHLSTFDILIVAMACELAYVGERENTYLVTGDKRMKTVVDRYRAVDLHELRNKIPQGPLGEIESGRWSPPKCIYVYRIHPGDLERVEGQNPIRL